MRKNKIDIKLFISEALKSVFTGASMLIPGVSGGTMALVFGFYDRLIEAVGNLFTHFVKSLLTLLFYMVFVAGGFLAFAGVMSWLTAKAALPTFAFFIGCILGGLPVVFSKARVGKFRVYDILYPVAGGAFVLLLSRMPEGLVSLSGASGITGWLLLFCAGLLIAVALVMPGISFSHMLLVLGMYESVINAVKSFDILYLLPIGIASGIGVLLLAKLLDMSMKMKPKQTFLTVLGFAAASAVDIFIEYLLPILQGIPSVIIALLAVAAGFMAVYLISRHAPDSPKA